MQLLTSSRSLQKLRSIFQPSRLKIHNASNLRNKILVLWEMENNKWEKPHPTTQLAPKSANSLPKRKNLRLSKK